MALHCALRASSRARIRTPTARLLAATTKPHMFTARATCGSMGGTALAAAAVSTAAVVGRATLTTETGVGLICVPAHTCAGGSAAAASSAAASAGGGRRAFVAAASGTGVPSEALPVLSVLQGLCIPSASTSASCAAAAKASSSRRRAAAARSPPAAACGQEEERSSSKAGGQPGMLFDRRSPPRAPAPPTRRSARAAARPPPRAPPTHPA